MHHLSKVNTRSLRQPSTGVLSKRCSESMQQIHRRTPMPKLLYNFIEIALRHGCSPVNLQHIFRTPFTKSTSERLLLKSYSKIWVVRAWHLYRNGSRAIWWKQISPSILNSTLVILKKSNVSETNWNSLQRDRDEEIFAHRSFLCVTKLRPTSSVMS